MTLVMLIYAQIGPLLLSGAFYVSVVVLGLVLVLLCPGVVLYVVFAVLCFISVGLCHVVAIIS
jgi:hypothetical protein